MCSKEFCADFHCEILPIETEKHGRMNPTKKTGNPRIFSSNLSVTFCENSTKRGFVLDIILIFTISSSDWFDVFFPEHMNNKIKGNSCFSIGNDFRHGFDFDQTFPP